MHDHHCAHVLLYCSSCDVAYCSRCSREWGKYTNWYWPNTNRVTTYPNSTSANDTVTISGVHSQGNHTG